jgi:KipI family sensor histidine kinase inhibitor
MECKFLPAGDRALTVEFGSKISEEINNAVIGLKHILEQQKIIGIEEIITTYRSLLIYYNPLLTDLVSLINKIQYIANNKINTSNPINIKNRTCIVPVLYGAEFGPDLSFVAKYNNLTEDEVIEIHSSVAYKVYMIGFAPGFPYLGGMSNKIATPRLETPRKLVHAGSVGIAGSQTGIYSIDDPGGWRIIGRTPLKLYNPHNNPPVLFSAGDYIKFKPINIEEYKEIEKQIELNSYNLEWI